MFLSRLLISAALVSCTLNISTAHSQTVGHASAPNSLYKPSGSGPFPAVILLHTGRGVLSHPEMWAEDLKRWGFVAHVFRSREAVYKRRSMELRDHVNSRSADVGSAYSYVSALPFVDKKRIGLVGFSIGGVVTLNVMSKRPFEQDHAMADLFRAAIAFYPACHLAVRADATYNVPTKILMGEDDTLVKPARCQELVESNKQKGGSLEISLFPNANHVFDVPRKTPRKGRGRAFVYNQTAHQEAKAEVKSFMNKHLKKQQ